MILSLPRLLLLLPLRFPILEGGQSLVLLSNPINNLPGRGVLLQQASLDGRDGRVLDS